MCGHWFNSTDVYKRQGAGSWGTALTWLLTNNGHQVTVWSALADEITMLQEKHEQTSKLPGVILDDSVVFTTDLKAAVEGMDLLVLAVPSPFTRSTAHQLSLIHICPETSCFPEG